MISFVIPTYREAPWIVKTIRQFEALQSVPHEVIISDNNSDDETVERAQEFADHVVRNRDTRLTIAEVRNRGAHKAQYEYLVFLDSAVTIPHPEHFFKTALARFEKNKSLVALGVKVRVDRDKATFADNFFFGLLDWWIRITNNVIKSGAANGKFMMIRADAFKKVKGFDVTLAASEDFDIFKRLSKVGRVYFDPTLTVYHPGRRAHAYGWPKLLAIWIINGLGVLLFRHSICNEWKSVR